MAKELLPSPQMLHQSGAFAPGGKVEFYLSGTTTPATVYSDSAATVVLAQPVVADASGILPQIFTTSSSDMKAVITASDDTAIATIDPVPKVDSQGATATSISFSPVTGNAATSVQGAIENNTTEVNKVKGIGALVTNGMLARVGIDAYAARTLQGSDGIDVAFGNGVSGPPAFSLNIPTQAEAEAGTDNGKAMTALRVSQAIAASYTKGIPVATTSGTTVLLDDTIPSGVRLVEVLLNGVSLSGTDDILVQIGSGGFATPTYNASSAFNGAGAKSTTGLIIRVASGPRAITGTMAIRNFTGNTWVAEFEGHDDGATPSYIAASGKVTIAGVIDRVRLASSGTDTFDAGSASASYT